jgi:UDP-N-acetylmuramoyl-tripeptide--D-alanyl-D-alanine ligase
MHFFQQEEYDNFRFICYIAKNPRLIDKKVSLAIALLSLTYLLSNNIAMHFGLLGAILTIFAYCQVNPCKNSKKPLVITARVLRLLAVTLFISFIITITTANNPNKQHPSWFLYMLSILLIQSTPLIIICANILLLPLEKLFQFKYLKEAKTKLAKYNPIIIGITGSYGKTSTKHILANILSSVAPTLATPGSINTTMGITRIIREQLKPEHKFFIVEMGAYGKNSIAKLCKLTPPTHGIITAIGNAHFERFKTIENVAYAKFALAQAVAQHNTGFMVINSDAIEQRFIAQYYNQVTVLVHHATTAIDHSSNSITYTDRITTTCEVCEASKGGWQTGGPQRECGGGPFGNLTDKGQLPYDLDKSNAQLKALAVYTITQAQQAITGVNFGININDQNYIINTNLYGLHHVENMALCFALAHKIGISPETIIAALKLTPQIRHRLEVIKDKTKPIVIDDAYNSNPTGFTAALAVLNTFKLNGYRTILVTPGMVELGELHDAKHFELGAKAAEAADYVAVVLPKRIPSFIAGFNSKADKSQQLLTFDTFQAAKDWLQNNTTVNDAILLENDLPDLYESKVSF